MSDYKFNLNTLVDIKPSHFRFDTEGKEVLLLDEKGFHYKGQTIDDAGEAYRLFMNWMNTGQKRIAEMEQELRSQWERIYEQEKINTKLVENARRAEKEKLDCALYNYAMGYEDGAQEQE